MANQIRDSIAEKLRDNVYALLADEATDVSHKKQLSICLRLIEDQYQIKEFFMGFVRLYRFDAATLAKEIRDFLINHNISLSMANFSAIIQALQDLIHDGGGRAIDARGVSTDLGSAQNLINTIYEPFNRMRNEISFKDLFQQAIAFGIKMVLILVDLFESTSNNNFATF
ncbi:unnamed protein product [Didymodactylos carnosus]|uniref:DUF4371 domain-containing protein n=1 Tax=Didymodactylos carnosus TaxID=1234261 RepID=A0A814XIY5_9BILA|nr:unnamed protein product [Didymodactylos carnosus]CAF3980279.1 unnamed protein product [Didymodactylos carnosus]